MVTFFILEVPDYKIIFICVRPNMKGACCWYGVKTSSRN